MAQRGRKPSNPDAPRPGWAERIARARATAGLSQERLADLVGRSQTAIGEYERGQSEPDLATFGRLGRVLMVAAGWLAFGEPRDGDPLAETIVEGNKKDRLFTWTFHQAARLLSEEGLEGDLPYLVAFTKKLVGPAQHSTDDAEAREVIRRALEAERAEIRAGLDQVRKNRL